VSEVVPPAARVLIGQRTCADVASLGVGGEEPHRVAQTPVLELGISRIASSMSIP
jgi:hypothetical protein